MESSPAKVATAIELIMTANTRVFFTRSSRSKFGTNVRSGLRRGVVGSGAIDGLRTDCLRTKS